MYDNNKIYWDIPKQIVTKDGNFFNFKNQILNIRS